MSRERVTCFLMFAVVLIAIAPAVVWGESLGCNYANRVAALSPPVYLRLNETPGVTVATPVDNDGTLGAAFPMIWGIHKAGGTTYYANSQPVSGISSLNPDVMIGGNYCIGLEDNNKGAAFKNYKDSNPDAAYSLGLNVYDDSSSNTQVAALNMADLTYSLFFKTTQTTVDLDGTAYATSGSTANIPQRLITSHPDNNAVGRFDLLMNNGTVILVTGASGNNVATCAGGFNDGNWHHLVATRQGSDANNAKLYIDGVQRSLVVSSDAAGLGALAGFGLRIGTRGNVYYGFTGTMDEIAMWGRALSNGEATGLFGAATVPEPSSIALLVTMLLGGVAFSRRKP
jgi:hypothetical protein